MTDKQIINVIDCNYHNNGKCTNSEIGQCNCANVASCYYKEYKRKEQECEELKKQLEEESKLGHKAIQDEADTFFDLLKVQKELDQLKEENKKLEKANNTLHNDLFEIKQKIKQYKEDSEAYKKCYKNNLKNLRDTEFNLTKLADKYMKFEKTLAEIKEIANKIANYYDGDEYELMWEDAEQILRKINEAELEDGVQSERT